MKVNISLLAIALGAVTNALPQPLDNAQLLHDRDVVATLETRNSETDFSPAEELWKRKGGGGGGGKGGGGGGSSGGSGGSSSGGSSSGGSSSGGSSSGGSSGSSGGSSSSGGSHGSGSSSSSSGGRTTTGSGASASYGKGYYGGGAAVPYTAGGRSASGISPLLFVGAGAFAVFPALWLYGVYSYPYVHPYTFHNSSANTNQTKPVDCLCEEYSECGCDENGDNSQLAQLIGDGDYSQLNKSVITVADINGTSTIVINGTLPNGTTAAGGTDSPDAAAGLQISGYWLMIALVGCTVFLT